jgi:pyruvate kinase
MKKAFNKTKIVATLGPASSSKEVLLEMIRAGVNVCRINASHGSYEHHQKVIDIILEINQEQNLHTSILVDLQGPKMRIGVVENNGVELIDGNDIMITTEECIGTAEKIYLTYPDFPKDVAIGDAVLIDDGKIKLVVIESNGKDLVKAKIVYGGTLSSKKGFNLPNTKISLPCLTPKDLSDLDFALKNNVNWIGLSFVRCAADILELRSIINAQGKTAKIIAKIEKPEAVRDIDEIIAVTDAIMVARGDLGVEMPMEQLPVIQKMLVNKSIKASKPIIIATQMMESMITNFSPTRAEVSDVANSVLDGADAVMLSGETSVGKYPVKVVEYMSNIIATVENESLIHQRENQPVIESETFISDSICFNACNMARQVDATAIIGMTSSGYTAFKVASHRPHARIFVFTENRPLLYILSLVWGIRGFYYEQGNVISMTHCINDFKEILKKEHLIYDDEMIINIASLPLIERGKANMIKISKV